MLETLFENWNPYEKVFVLYLIRLRADRRIAQNERKDIASAAGGEGRAKGATCRWCKGLQEGLHLQERQGLHIQQRYGWCVYAM